MIIFGASFTTRLVPVPLYDRSIYQSVAERMMAGDRLYVDVIDNKDPLFYYAVALQRLIGPLAEYGFELACVLGSALIAANLARRAYPACLAGQRLTLIGTAFMLTGLHYDLGGSIPPGIVLTLVTIWLALDRRGTACGLAFAVLGFTKLIYAPIALTFIVAHELSRRRGSPGEGRFAGMIGLAAILGAIAIVGFLWVRGELAGYLSIQAANIFYSSNNVFVAKGIIGNLINHILTAVYFGKVILALSFGVFALLLYDLRHSPVGDRLQPYRVACVAIYPVSLAILALTAIWGAHLAVLHIFLALAGALLVPGLLTQHRAGTVYPAILAAGLVLSGVGSENEPISDPLDFRDRLQALVAPSDEAEALRRVGGPGPLRYARLGSDNDFHHAAGTRADSLMCPQFYQYRFTDPQTLQRIVDCAARTDVLIVDFPEDEPLAPGTFVSPVANFVELNRRWNGFVADAEAMLRRHFQCVRQGETIRICKRITSS